MNDLCTTYQFAPEEKCPDPAVVRYAVQPGCKCKKGYALIEAGKCAKIGSKKCPAVAAKTDCRFYRGNLEAFCKIISDIDWCRRILNDVILSIFTQFRPVAMIQTKYM